MSIFSKIKNTLTGGWAELTIEIGEGQRGQSLPFTVKCKVASDPISITRVYVRFQANEIVNIPNYRSNAYDNRGADNLSGNNLSDNDEYYDVSSTESLLEIDIDIAGAQELAAGEECDWSGQIEIPDHLPPTMNGKYAAVEWLILVGLDMPGNDPDSGWHAVKVN